MRLRVCSVLSRLGTVLTSPNIRTRHSALGTQHSKSAWRSLCMGAGFGCGSRLPPSRTSCGTRVVLAGGGFGGLSAAEVFCQHISEGNGADLSLTWVDRGGPRWIGATNQATATHARMRACAGIHACVYLNSLFWLGATTLGSARTSGERGISSSFPALDRY